MQLQRSFGGQELFQVSWHMCDMTNAIPVSIVRQHLWETRPGDQKVVDATRDARDLRFGFRERSNPALAARVGLSNRVGAVVGLLSSRE
jgi:hypothetical protein